MLEMVSAEIHMIEFAPILAISTMRDHEHYDIARGIQATVRLSTLNELVHQSFSIVFDKASRIGMA
jgi:hypothetical protein